MKRLLFILLLCCSPLSATTYYVKVGGNDGAAGTSWAAAWESTGKVNSTATGGDTVFYGTGTFNGQIIPAAGGSAGDRTVYACSSFVQGITTLEHTTILTGWTSVTGNIYRAFCDGADDEVWGDDNCAVVAQIDGSYDTILVWRSAADSLEAAGQFFWNSANDSIYVWLHGGGNPSGSTIKNSEGPIVYFANGQDYVTIWGFNIQYGEDGGVYFNNSETGGGHDFNTIERCNFNYIMCPPGVNCAGVIGNYGGSHADSTWMSHQTLVRACSTFYVREWTTTNDPSHSSGVRFYSHWRTRVDSCYMQADTITGDGINFKSEGRYITIAYNVILGGADAGIHFQCYYHTDSIYGNIINGITGDTGLVYLGEDYYGIRLEGCEPDSNVHIYNNTIYSPQLDGIETGSDEPMQANGYIKYNIISSVRNAVNVAFNNNDHLDYAGNVDSNMYYPASVGFGVNGAVTWATWQGTYGFDANGTNNVDPAFNNAANNDFSRPGASDEMNLEYGGRTWTVFGAVQPAEAASTGGSGTSGSVTYSGATTVE